MRQTEADLIGATVITKAINALEEAPESALERMLALRGDEQGFLLRLGAMDALARARAEIRTRIAEMARVADTPREKPAARPEPAHEAPVARAIARMGFYGWPLPLPGAKLLGDATAAELRASAEHHAGKAQVHQARAAFYTRLAERLEATQAARVRDAISDEEIARILGGAE